MTQEAELGMPPNCWFCAEPREAKCRARNVRESAKTIARVVALINPNEDVDHYTTMTDTLASLEATATALEASAIQSVKTWSLLSRTLECPGPIITDACTLELRKQL